MAHLLWWSSCPDSSISMIDQLSSCWWHIGKEGGEWAGELERKMKEHYKHTHTQTTSIQWITNSIQFYFTEYHTQTHTYVYIYNKRILNFFHINILYVIFMNASIAGWYPNRLIGDEMYSTRLRVKDITKTNVYIGVGYFWLWFTWVSFERSFLSLSLEQNRILHLKCFSSALISRNSDQIFMRE